MKTQVQVLALFLRGCKQPNLSSVCFRRQR